MRAFAIVAALLLTGADPAQAPVGTFRKWLSFERKTLDFTSGGMAVHVEALPCPAHPVGDSTCGWEGYNNQGAVTATVPGMAPVTVVTDRESKHARLAVVFFDRRDARPGLIVESQAGGSGGDMNAQLLVPEGDGYRVLRLGRGMTDVQGELADGPSDLSGDGRVDLKLGDAAFDSLFGCNACTPRPPRLFAVVNGSIVDESRDPALRGVFAAEMRRLAPACLSDAPDRNGACAAFVADAARAGMFDRAWAAMLRHYEHGRDVRQFCDLPVADRPEGRCPDRYATHYSDFPQSLRAFLTRAGYLPS